MQGAGLVWFLGTFLILRNYEIETFQALIDAGIFTLLFVGMVTVLDRIFTFYNPKSGNMILLFILPLILSFLVVLLHRFSSAFAFADDLEYLEFLGQHFYLRWAILALAAMMITLLAVVMSRLEQQEETKNRELHMMELSKEAELSQLRQQLQPHFLFNSLNSISALVMSQPERAREMVVMLSDFLRGTIRKDLKAWTSLKEELEYLQMYLEIERVRFGHRLEVLFEISPDSEKLKIPQLLIQPLLENAIKHGLYGVTGEVKIHLSSKKDQHYLVIQIDNPFDPETPSQKGTGFGLSSLRRRLYLLFGRNDLLTTQKEGSDFSVNLKIPQPK
ncbi:MAG: histidine kinase [Algoriphagus sp.]|nr:histidine kinase [Algoriphagus sp.]